MQRVVGLAMLLALACARDTEGQIQSSDPVAQETVIAPIDFGDGVHYFRATGDGFAHSLAAFKKTHPELVVTAVSADNTGYSSRHYNGYTVGYFVSTEPRNSCTCSETPKQQ